MGEQVGARIINALQGPPKKRSFFGEEEKQRSAASPAHSGGGAKAEFVSTRAYSSAG